IRISTLREVVATAAKKGVHAIDAPVSRGSVNPGPKGIVFMLGGPPEDDARAEGFAEHAASKIIKTGALGTGMALKICNNLLTYLTMVSAQDAINLAEASGLNVGLLGEVTSNNGVAGKMLSFLLARRAGTAPTAQGAPVSAESAAGLGEKDLDCALEVGRDL